MFDRTEIRRDEIIIKFTKNCKGQEIAETYDRPSPEETRYIEGDPQGISLIVNRMVTSVLKLYVLLNSQNDKKL